MKNSYSGSCSSKSNIRVRWNLTLCRRILCFAQFSDRRIFVNVRGSLSCFRLVSIESFPMYFDPKSIRKESDENLVRSDRYSPEEIGFRCNPISDSIVLGQDPKVGLNHLGIDNDDELIISLKKYISKELPDYWVVNDIHFIATMLHLILIIHHIKGNLCQGSFHTKSYCSSSTS